MLSEKLKTLYLNVESLASSMNWNNDLTNILFSLIQHIGDFLWGFIFLNEAIVDMKAVPSANSESLYLLIIDSHSSTLIPLSQTRKPIINYK
jgi:hypothetical protein